MAMQSLEALLAAYGSGGQESENGVISNVMDPRLRYGDYYGLAPGQDITGWNIDQTQPDSRHLREVITDASGATQFDKTLYDAPFDFMKDFALPALAIWGGGALLGGALGGVGLGQSAALGLDQVAALGGAGEIGGTGAAIGNGAFLGEGVASGIGAWDSAAGLSALGGGAAAGGGSFSPSMNYGPGMSGVETSIYDKTLGLTGSKGIADAAATVLGPAGNLMPSMPGPSSSWLNLIQGGLGLIQSNKLSQLGNPTEANQLAQAQLAALLKDPAGVTKLPGYEAGLEAVQRTGAAQGYTGSGNMMLALQKYGGDFYNNTLNTLNSLGQTGAPIQQGYKMGSTELLGNALNNLSYGATKLFGWGG